MPSQLAVITIDAIQPQVVADFWCAVLGWQVIEGDNDVISISFRPVDRISKGPHSDGDAVRVR